MDNSIKPCIVWLKNDLRLDDNPALSAAVKSGRPIVLCFIWSEEDQAPYLLGPVSQAWLYKSLEALQSELRGHLVIRKGNYLHELEKLQKEIDAASIFWNRRYEPHLIAKDSQIMQAFRARSLDVHSFCGNVLIEPWLANDKENKPYKVFTPFYKSCSQRLNINVAERPNQINFYTEPLKSLAISELSLPQQSKQVEFWKPGEAGAQEKLADFIDKASKNYGYLRDFPAVDGTSKLSPHLHFGEISVRRVYSRLASQPESESFIRELLWREFAIHLLYHFPNAATVPLKSEFVDFPWRDDPAQLALWQEGKTGYPIVDAGIRELLTTGWMHNRVRMIAASFLIKHLLLSWNAGERFFWQTLIDADLANNSLGWQWVAGCGADAAPYVRIFNPVLQGQKFDPEGQYVKRWLPELAGVPPEFIHTPWQLATSTYPKPIIDLDFGRERALEAFSKLNTN